LRRWGTVPARDCAFDFSATDRDSTSARELTLCSRVPPVGRRLEPCSRKSACYGSPEDGQRHRAITIDDEDHHRLFMLLYARRPRLGCATRISPGSRRSRRRSRASSRIRCCAFGCSSDSRREARLSKLRAGLRINLGPRDEGPLIEVDLSPRWQAAAAGNDPNRKSGRWALSPDILRLTFLARGAPIRLVAPARGRPVILSLQGV